MEERNTLKVTGKPVLSRRGPVRVWWVGGLDGLMLIYNLCRDRSREYLKIQTEKYYLQMNSANRNKQQNTNF